MAQDRLEFTVDAAQALRTLNRLQNTYAAVGTSVSGVNKVEGELIKTTNQLRVSKSTLSQINSSLVKSNNAVAQATKNVTSAVKQSNNAFKKQLGATIAAQEASRAGSKLTGVFNNMAAASKTQQQVVQDNLTQLGFFNKKVDEANKKSGQFEITWKSVAKIFTGRAISAGISKITAELSEGLDTTIAYSEAIAQIRTIDVAGLGYTEWASQLREVSDAYGIDVVKQTGAAYQALSNQVVQGAQTFEFLAQANELALTGIASTEQSVNLLSSILNAYGEDVANVDQISGQLFKTVELGRVKIGNIADSFGRVAVTGSQLGISLEELLAFMTVTTNQGLKETEAMAALNGVMQKLIRPSDELSNIFADIGSVADATKILGFQGVLERIITASEGSTEKLGEFFGRIRGIRGILAVATGAGTQYSDALDKIANSAGSYSDKVDIATKNLGRQLEKEFTQIKNFFQQDIFGANLRQLVAFTGGVEDLDEVVKSLTKTALTALNVTVAVSAVKFLATSKAITSARETLVLYATMSNRTATVTAALTAVLTPLNVIMAAVGLAVYGVTKAYQVQQEVLKELSDTTREYASRQVEEIQRANAGIGKALAEQAKDWDRLDAVRRAAINKLSAREIESLNGMRKTGVASFEAQRQAALKLANDGLGALSKKAKEYTADLRVAERTIQQINKSNLKTTESVETRIFEEEFSKKNVASKVKTLRDEIDKLRRESVQQAENADLLGFDKSREKLNSFTDRLRELSKVQPIATSEVGIDVLRDNAKEEVRLRTQIRTEYERQAQVAKTNIKSTEEEIANLKEQIAGIKSADLASALKLDKPLADAKSLTSELTKIKEVISELGTSPELQQALQPLAASYEEQAQKVQSLNTAQSESAKLSDERKRLESETDKVLTNQTLALQQLAKLTSEFQTRDIKAVKTGIGQISGPRTELNVQNGVAAELGTSPTLAKEFNKTLNLLKATLDIGTPTQQADAQVGVLKSGLEVASAADTVDAQNRFLETIKQITGVSKEQLTTLLGTEQSYDALRQAIDESKTGVDDLKLQVDTTTAQLSRVTTEQNKQIEILNQFGAGIKTSSDSVIESQGKLTTQINKTATAFADAARRISAIAKRAQTSSDSEGSENLFYGGEVTQSGLLPPNKRGFGADKISHRLQQGEIVMRGSVSRRHKKELLHMNRYGEFPTAVAKPEKVIVNGASEEVSTGDSYTINVNEAQSARMTGKEINQQIRRERYLRGD